MRLKAEISPQHSVTLLDLKERSKLGLVLHQRPNQQSPQAQHRRETAGTARCERAPGGANNNWHLERRLRPARQRRRPAAASLSQKAAWRSMPCSQATNRSASTGRGASPWLVPLDRRFPRARRVGSLDAGSHARLASAKSPRGLDRTGCSSPPVAGLGGWTSVGIGRASIGIGS